MNLRPSGYEPEVRVTAAEPDPAIPVEAEDRLQSWVVVVCDSNRGVWQ